MKSKLIILAVILVGVLFSACSPNLEVSNIKDIEEFDEEVHCYVLPQTVLRVEVSAVLVKERRGPYANYATKFMGYDAEDIIWHDHDQWYLDDIQISDYQIPDTAHYYIVENMACPSSVYQHLKEQGYILPLNYAPVFDTQKYTASWQSPDSLFTDHRMKRHLVEKEKMVYRTVRTDSSTVRVRDKTTEIGQRSQEEYAQRTAHNIIRLRKRRFKLLMGMAGITNAAPETAPRYFPEGDALRVQIAELNHMEQELIETFKGKVLTDTVRMVLEYTPQMLLGLGEVELFSFSPERGLLPKQSIQGEPVFLQLNRSLSTDPLQKARQTMKKPVVAHQGFVYRVPELVTFNVLIDNELIAQRKLLVAQFGALMLWPLKD